MIEVFVYKAKTKDDGWFYGYCKLEDDGTRNPICDRNSFLIVVSENGNKYTNIHKDNLIINTICLADDSLPNSEINAFEGDLYKIGEYYFPEEKIRDKNINESDHDYSLYLEDCFDAAEHVEVVREVVFENGNFKFKNEEKEGYNIGYFRSQTYEDTFDDCTDVIGNIHDNPEILEVSE